MYFLRYTHTSPFDIFEFWGGVFVVILLLVVLALLGKIAEWIQEHWKEILVLIIVIILIWTLAATLQHKKYT